MRTTMTGTGGPPIVFVHGFACDPTDWSAQTASFEPRTTVVTCELPGHSAELGSGADFAVDAFGAEIVRALSSLNLPPATLVGHSMGCRFVLEANRIAPDMAAGLVLVDGSSIGSGDSAAAEAAMSNLLAGDRYRPFVRRFFESMFVPTSDPALAHRIVERALLLPGTAGRALLVDTARWDASSAAAALDSVRVPLLAIQSTTMNGAHERVSLAPGMASPWLDLVGAHVPSGRIVILPGTGHFAQIERAAEVTEVITQFIWG